MLLEWADKEVGNTNRNIEKLMKEIDAYRNKADSVGDEEDLRSNEKELEKLLLQEEIH